MHVVKSLVYEGLNWILFFPPVLHSTTRKFHFRGSKKVLSELFHGLRGLKAKSQEYKMRTSTSAGLRHSGAKSLGASIVKLCTRLHSMHPCFVSAAHGQCKKELGESDGGRGDGWVNKNILSAES